MEIVIEERLKITGRLSYKFGKRSELSDKIDIYIGI